MKDFIALTTFEQVSGKDFIKRSWRTMSDFVELEVRRPKIST